MVNSNVILSLSLMLLGLMGVYLNRRHFLGALMAIELILLGVNVNLINYGVNNNSLDSLVFAVFIIGVAACEAALGIAILIFYYKNQQRVGE